MLDVQRWFNDTLQMIDFSQNEYNRFCGQGMEATPDINLNESFLEKADFANHDVNVKKEEKSLGEVRLRSFRLIK